MKRTLRALFRKKDVEAELVDELDLHLELEADDLVQQGWTRAAARREARRRLGGVEQTKESVRDVRPLQWLGALWLDVKLGLRVLRRTWGLTLVAGFAMAVVIGIAACAFTIFQPAAWGTLPLDEGGRIVALKTWDGAAQRARPPFLSDFERWRLALRSVEDIGAFRTVERNLVETRGGVETDSAAGAAGPVSIAEMTASGFALARVAPLLGRPLLEEDERNGAPPVVVIGYTVWQARFASDPNVVGQTVRIGRTVHTIVGVMPEDFAFPVNHRFWTPLRADLLDDSPDEEPEVFVFARLAPGVTLEGAQAELATVGLLPSAAGPEADSQLEPRVVSYALGIVGNGEPIERLMISLGMFLISLIIVPPCANIAILVYARTVTRQEEFAARYALGAGRGRIVVQVFVEVLVLALGAAGVALAALRIIVTQGLFVGVNDPFWIDYSDISLLTVLFALGLAVFAALIAGAIPAIRATGNMMQPGLSALSSRTRIRLGATWTALVVAQVAFSVAVLPTAVELAWGSLRPAIRGPSFAAGEFLTAEIAMDEDAAEDGAGPLSFASSFGVVQDELVRQLNAEPGVRELTVSSAAPGAEPWAYVEVELLDEIDGQASSGGEGDEGDEGSVRVSPWVVGTNRVDEAFFEVFDVPLLAGTGFRSGDSGPAAVVVNRTFAEDILGDRNPLGQRLRYIRTGTGTSPASEPGPWFEIVGVVGNVPANSDVRTIYHSATPREIHPSTFSLRVGSGSDVVAGRIREIAAAIDPALRVDDVLRLNEVYRRRQLMTGLLPGAFLVAAVTLSVLLLSAAGLYALMSFTVNQRRREIAIRTALGAPSRRLLGGVFRRALTQVGVGGLVGLGAAAFLDYYVSPGLERGLAGIGFENIPGIVPGAGALIVLIGAAAVIGPCRRALRVEPAEALREG